MLKIKQIEKKVNMEIREYIRDLCWDKSDFFSVTEKVEETTKGIRYVCKMYKNPVFNQEKYERELRKYYIENLQEKEVKKTEKKTREKGKNITVNEFFELIFRDHFDYRKDDVDRKGRKIYLKSFTFEIDKETHTLEGKKVAKTLEKMKSIAKKYEYFTPALFISHKFFTKETLALLGVIILDFDLDKAKITMTKEQLRQYIKKKLKVEPALIWDTGTKGNYQAAILIQPMAGTIKSVHLYEQVVKEMIHKFGKLADKTTFNANHIFRIPKNDRRNKRYVRKYNETVHDIDAFRWLLNERDERRRSESKVKNFTKESIIRHPAIEALMSGSVTHRDNAAFTLALFLRWMGRSEFECENFMLSQWLPNVNTKEFDHSFTPNEAKKCIRNAYSDRYKCFRSEWIEFCTGIDCDLSGYFIWSPNINEGKYIMDTEKRLKEYLRKNEGVFVGTIAELMEEIGVKRTALKEHIKKMQESNELLYEAARGRGTKAKFTLLEQITFERHLIQERTNIDDELNNLKSLEDIMLGVI